MVCATRGFEVAVSKIVGVRVPPSAPRPELTIFSHTFEKYGKIERVRLPPHPFCVLLGYKLGYKLGYTAGKGDASEVRAGPFSGRSQRHFVLLAACSQDAAGDRRSRADCAPLAQDG